MRTNGQAAAKYPLRIRIIGWTILVAVLGGLAFLIWDAIVQGKVLGLVMGGVVAAIVGWKSYRNAAGAKSR